MIVSLSVNAATCIHSVCRGVMQVGENRNNKGKSAVLQQYQDYNLIRLLKIKIIKNFKVINTYSISSTYLI